MQQRQSLGDHFPSLVIVSGLLAWGCFQVGPLYVGSELQWLPAVLYGVTALMGLRIVIHCLTFIARFFEWTSAHQATGKDGTASWATEKDLKKEFSKKLTGPFWGRMATGGKSPIFSDYASNALTVAPAGSGKGIYSVITNGLSIKQSKVFSDFKGELVCILKKPLEKRGEKVRVLNPGGLWQSIIGESDCYNPLDIIVDDLERPGGLRDVPDDLREQSAQILPEPAQNDGENTYWREGSRHCIGIAKLLETMIEGRDATLSSVALLIEDREALEHNLRWVVGIDLEGNPLPDGPMPIESCAWAQIHDAADLAEFIQWVRAQARGLLALMGNGESRTFDSFISGAQQALAPFAFGRLAPAMRRSSFRMNDLKSKDTPTSLFIVADASRMEAYKSYIGLIQWCAMTAIKRHENKSVRVYFIMDEATNYKIHGLENLLTWGRSYGLLLHIIFQDISAFEKTYGKTAVETLLSETEIKQFLPGQRSPKTLEMISQLLGSQSVMSAGLSPSENGLQENTSEAGRPLMTPAEVRQTKHGLLFIRQSQPALIEPISYGEVHPWRKQAGINPFHGKPFLKKVKLRQS
ncbi:type IV secretory system conjugative DNA transfer family protein [Halioxenophilus sp. WMMB6]|uniref:type IV secretory system conjugative DNA transfer family protein n=1 Tax=Halioxenophilus sp. WMMB6 TaxID=3073815 RepID=UPI00295EF052|nr:type IV secretory system conjugative DNA transfer family protein [Halioxenophilus sp. WMMB6]